MSLSITAVQIKAIAGAGARADLVAAIVNGWPAAVAKAKLTTRNRAAHFLAQIMSETGGLRILEESAAYRAPRIMEIFGEGKHSAGITAPEARRIAALPLAQRGPSCSTASTASAIRARCASSRTRDRTTAGSTAVAA